MFPKDISDLYCEDVLGGDDNPGDITRNRSGHAVFASGESLRRY